MTDENKNEVSASEREPVIQVGEDEVVRDPSASDQAPVEVHCDSEAAADITLPTCEPVHCIADLPTGRRCFLAQAGAVVLTSVALAPAVFAAASTVLTPMKKHFGASKAKAEGGDVKEYPVGTFAELPEDGAPLLVSIRDELVDGWSKEVNVVGAIYARRVGDGIKVLHTMCPHMGSTVGLKKDEKMFFCPSHSAWFDWDGKRVEKDGSKNPCKRDMDELEARVAEDGTIMVQFCCFKSDSAEKIPV